MAEPVGRPRRFATPEEFEKLADAYFEEKEMTGGKISWTGLCLAVGLTSRQGLDRYKNGEHGENFVGPIKRALLRVENYYEENEGGAKDIFVMKNFDWKDRQELDANIKGDLSVSTVLEQGRRRAANREKPDE